MSPPRHIFLRVSSCTYRTLLLHLHHLQTSSPDGVFERPVCAEVAGLGALEWRNLVDVDRVGLEQRVSEHAGVVWWCYGVRVEW